ncbi:hypothetical protein ACET3Z_014709 [Daucus carota]
MAERRLTELPGEGESSEHQDSGARQNVLQHPPHPQPQFPHPHSLFRDRPTIIFGADVIHPHPGEDSIHSIAAVVASQDWPDLTKYAGLVCTQAHGQELIQDLYKSWEDPKRGTMRGGIIKDLFISFRRSTGQKPQRVIFYRDGISEMQINQVFQYELDAIREACAALDQDYKPPVTYVVVQKNDLTGFANNHHVRSSDVGSGNILPGTVLDSENCQITDFDFYVQNTSPPVHYHVIYDENKFSSDGLQSLTNNLSHIYAGGSKSMSIEQLGVQSIFKNIFYIYARDPRSISIVVPACYDHEAASLARLRMEPETSDCESTVSGAADSQGGMGIRGSTTTANADAAASTFPKNLIRVIINC